MDIAQTAPDTVILAQDEASLYLQASLMRVWAPVGQTPVVKVATSRQSTHFYGALNLQTGEETFLRSDLMTAQVTALFLNRVLLAYPDIPILMLWDRAPWHKGGSDPLRACGASTFGIDVLSGGQSRTQSAGTRLEGNADCSEPQSLPHKPFRTGGRVCDASKVYEVSVFFAGQAWTQRIMC